METAVPTFTINYKDGKPVSITCKICDMTSYNPNDILYRYCGMCGKFHDSMHIIEKLYEKKQTIKKVNNRIFSITAFALMIAMLILSFIRMAINNTGIVAEFGVWPSAAICIATGAAGVLIGKLLVKALRK